LRPVLMTDATAAVAWRARFRPFGELISVTGPKSLDARFPGQWFQFEAGLHANWHRNYDPTLGRTLEADPLGFPDGPNRYAYVGSSPLMFVDPEGRQAIIVGPRPIPIPIPTPGITPRPLPILPPTRGRPQAGEDCVEELNECDKLCQRASCDPDMKSVWYGSWSKCIRGCLSARCGGNRGTVY
jgi:RHS repeat-associated protein